MNKKIFSLLIFFFLGFTSGQLILNYAPSRLATGQEIIVKEKTFLNQIIDLAALKTELPQRKPASLKKVVISGEGRDGEEIQLSNQINPAWTSLAVNNLLKYQPPGTRLTLLPQEEIILIKNRQAYHAQQVQITYTQPNNTTTSFNASINIQNGQVIETWNRTHQENFLPGQGHRLRPSGTL